MGHAGEGSRHRFPSLIIVLGVFLAVLGGGCSYLISSDPWVSLAAAAILLVVSVWLTVRASRV